MREELERLRGEAMKYLDLGRHMTREEYAAYRALIDEIVALRIKIEKGEAEDDEGSEEN